MTATSPRIWDLFDLLREAGFSPEDHDPGTYREEWFRLDGLPYGESLRVILHPDDGDRAEAHMLDRRGWETYGIAFSGNVPVAVIGRTIDAMIGQARADALPTD